MIRIAGIDGLGHKLKVTDEHGRDIGSMLGIRYGGTITLGEIITAEFELCQVGADIDAEEVDYRLLHPVTGEHAPVSSIEFRDGTTMTFDEGGGVEIGEARHLPRA